MSSKIFSSGGSQIRERMMTWVRKAKSIQLGSCAGSWDPLWVILEGKGPVPGPPARVARPSHVTAIVAPEAQSSTICATLAPTSQIQYVLVLFKTKHTYRGIQSGLPSGLLGVNILVTVLLSWRGLSQSHKPHFPTPTVSLVCPFCRVQSFSGTSILCFSRVTAAS